MQPNEQQNLMAQLIQGKVQPVNDFVEYLVDKMQTGIIELDQIMAQKQRIASMSEDIRQRELRLRAELDAYTRDVLYWQREKPHDGKNSGSDDIGKGGSLGKS